jgi:hypothetical protein
MNPRALSPPLKKRRCFTVPAANRYRLFFKVVLDFFLIRLRRFIQTGIKRIMATESRSSVPQPTLSGSALIPISPLHHPAAAMSVSCLFFLIPSIFKLWHFKAKRRGFLAEPDQLSNNFKVNPF